MAGVGPAAAAGRARRLPSVTPTKASLHQDVISLSGADGNIGNLWPTAPRGRCRRLYAKMTMMACTERRRGLAIRLLCWSCGAFRCFLDSLLLVALLHVLLQLPNFFSFSYF